MSRPTAAQSPAWLYARPPESTGGLAALDGRDRECQAASGRYCRQVAGIVGEASWMKMWAPGVRGFTRGCMFTWWGSRSALRRVGGAPGGPELFPPPPPPLGGGGGGAAASDAGAPPHRDRPTARGRT